MSRGKRVPFAHGLQQNEGIMSRSPVIAAEQGLVLDQPWGRLTWLVSRELGFQVRFAEQVRRDSGVPTVAVGMILKPEHAQEILEKGQADLIALGRELLFNPNWAAQASVEMKGTAGWQDWPEEFGWWLERRARQLAPKKTELKS